MNKTNHHYICKLLFVYSINLLTINTHTRLQNDKLHNLSTYYFLALFAFEIKASTSVFHLCCDLYLALSFYPYTIFAR